MIHCSIGDVILLLPITLPIFLAHIRQSLINTNQVFTCDTCVYLQSVFDMRTCILTLYNIVYTTGA